jgi:hypothetical protein
VRAVNVQIPSQPLLMSTTSAQGGVIEIMGTDGSLVVLTSSRGTSTTRNGVAIYDLPLPIQLVPGAFMELMDGPRFAALADGYLYVAVGATGMVVVDLNDPAGPRLIGTVPSDNSSQGVAVADGAVFVADGPGGLFTVPAQRCTPAH